MSAESGPPTAVVKRGKARPLWSGHPWAYARAIDRTPDVPPGTLVHVVDDEGRTVGWGHLGASSPIAIRLLSWSSAMPDESALVRERIREAHERRRAMGLPNERTTAFRLVFSEGDRLPGLIVDHFGEGLVVQLGTAGMLRLETTIVECLQELVKPTWIVVSTSADAARIEGLAEQDRVVLGESASLRGVTALEHGIQFEVDPVGGQKTGFYADQRDNRLRVARWCKDRSVLDAFCYGGAFGLTAARHGGAGRVVLLDSSPRACRMADRNAQANGIEAEVIEGDAMSYLREQALDEGFDAIFVDPPKFARSRKTVPEAIKKYRKLNEHAIRALPEGGILVSSSCSGHLHPDEFLRTLADAAFRTGRVLHVLEQLGQAACHPIVAAAPESSYLKCFVCEVRSAT